MAFFFPITSCVVGFPTRESLG